MRGQDDRGEVSHPHVGALLAPRINPVEGDPLGEFGLVKRGFEFGDGAAQRER
jgi:hypothetical protein